MIKPKDPPGAPGVLPNPHYQIIAIILPIEWDMLKDASWQNSRLFIQIKYSSWI